MRERVARVGRLVVLVYRDLLPDWDVSARATKRNCPNRWRGIAYGAILFGLPVAETFFAECFEYIAAPSAIGSERSFLCQGPKLVQIQFVTATTTPQQLQLT